MLFLWINLDHWIQNKLGGEYDPTYFLDTKSTISKIELLLFRD